MRKLKLEGKVSEAIIYAVSDEKDSVDEYAIAQIKLPCDNEVSRESKIRVMPDVHPSKVSTVGLTMTVGERIMPCLVGIDIGCGVAKARLKKFRLEYQKIDKTIRENISVDKGVRNKIYPMEVSFDFKELLAEGHKLLRKEFIMNKRQRKKLTKRKLRKLNMQYFTPCERWNLFHTFSVYIAAGLKDFLSHKIYGIPQEFLDIEEEMSKGGAEIEERKELYEELSHEVKNMIAEREQVPQFNNNEEKSAGMILWCGTIGKMVWSFEQLRDDCPDIPLKKFHDKQFRSLMDKGIKPFEITEEPDENGLHAFKFNGEETPQEIWDAEGKYREKIQEGIDLFSKYFQHLWD